MYLHIGYGSYIQQEEIKTISSDFKKGYINKIVEISKLKNDEKDYDFSNGNPKETLILLNNKEYVYSAIKKSELDKRMSKLKNTQCTNEIIHFGANNYIVAEEIRMFTGNVKAKPVVRKVKQAKEDGNFIDFTNNNPTRTFLFMKDGTIISTKIDETTLLKWLHK